MLRFMFQIAQICTCSVTTENLGINDRLREFKLLPLKRLFTL